MVLRVMVQTYARAAFRGPAEGDTALASARFPNPRTCTQNIHKLYVIHTTFKFRRSLRIVSVGPSFVQVPPERGLGHTGHDKRI